MANSSIAVDLFGVNNVGVSGVFFDTFESLLAILAASIALSTVGDDIAVCVDKSPSPLIRAVDEEFKRCCHSMLLVHTYDSTGDRGYFSAVGAVNSASTTVPSGCSVTCPSVTVSPGSPVAAIVCRVAS